MRHVVLVAVMSALALQAQAQTTVAGPTPGSFRVTESGAAEYRVPLRVPPGIAGVEPKLALVYNSQAGNGLLGVGWTLAGLPTITRCPRTMAQDGVRGAVSYDTNDRYCLDGQRLIVVSGSYGADGAEYRTELESFSKIVSYGGAGSGPAWFKVWTRSGQVMEYGKTEDSRIEALGMTHVRVWALNKVSDARSNTLTVTYAEDNGDFRPQRIDYPAGGSVQFSYEARSDATPAYHMGAPIKTTMRLAGAKSYAGASLVKDYRLSYETGASTARSRLISITECDAQGDCLAALTLQNQNSAESYAPWQFDQHAAGSWAPDWKILVADVNGDGKADLVASYTYSIGWETHTALGHGDGTFAPIVSQNHAPGSWAPDWKVFAADVNGDGRADLIATYTHPDGFGWQTHTALSNGDGTYAPRVFHQHAAGSWSKDWKILVADADGDGRADLIASFTYPEGFGWQTHTALSNGNGTYAPLVGHQHASGNWAPDWKILAADVNGDGKADLIATYTGSGGWQSNVAIGNGNGTFSPLLGTYHSAGSWATDWKIFALDANGDGKTDLVASYTYPNGFGWQTHTALSKGDGSFAAQVFHWQSTGNWAADWDILPADVNGDGKTDLIASYTYPNGFGWETHTALSNGDGTYATLATQQLSPGGNWAREWKVFAADFGGSGRAGLAASFTAPDGFGWQTHTSIRNGPFPDLLVSASNGAAGAQTIAYKPLTAAAVYAKDSGATYPRVDVQAPIYVVSSESSSDGIGGTQTNAYAYGGLKLDRAGRGLLGFRWLEATQQATGLKMRTELVQDWPYLGLPSLVRKTQSSGALLSQTASLYSCLDLLGGLCSVAPGNRYFPFLSQSVESGNDLNGVALPAVTTTASYDAFGNPTSIAVSTSDGHGKSTTNVFANDSVNWLLGRLLRSTVQSTSP